MADLATLYCLSPFLVLLYLLWSRNRDPIESFYVVDGDHLPTTTNEATSDDLISRNATSVENIPPSGALPVEETGKLGAHPGGSDNVIFAQDPEMSLQEPLTGFLSEEPDYILPEDPDYLLDCIKLVIGESSSTS